MKTNLVKVAMDSLLVRIRERYDEYPFVKVFFLTDGSGAIEDAQENKRLFTFRSIGELINHLEGE